MIDPLVYARYKHSYCRETLLLLTNCPTYSDPVCVVVLFCDAVYMDITAWYRVSLVYIVNVHFLPQLFQLTLSVV